MQYKTKLVSIRHFILDVDGVLTDGTVLINGEHYQRMILAKDSYALQYAVKQGLSFLLSQEENPPLSKTPMKS